MRRLILFLIALILLLSFLGIITIFLPSRVTVSKSIFINAGEKDVAAQVQDFQNWKNWNPLFQNKNIQVDITQNHDTSFAVLTNEDQKKLTLILLDSVNNKIHIKVVDGSSMSETYEFILLPNGTGETQLTWDVNTELGWYPWKRFAGIFMDKIKGPQYEAILQQLKEAVETHQ